MWWLFIRNISPYQPGVLDDLIPSSIPMRAGISIEQCQDPHGKRVIVEL